MNPKWLFLGIVVGVVLFALGFALGWGIAPPLVDNKIIESTAIIDGTDQFERFEKLPMPLTFKVYIFIIVNRDEITAGAKPIVKEVGPYVYLQYRTKQNIKFANDNNKITYKEKQLFVFDAEASGGLTEDDEITVLNVPLMGMFSAGKGVLNMFTNDAINTIFNDKLSDIFMTTTVKKFLFEGIPICEQSKPSTNIICTIIRSMAAAIETMRIEDQTVVFSFLHHKNYTSDGVWEVSTGRDDISSLGSIQSWKGDAATTTWGSQINTCNLIRGTDTTIFAPFAGTEGHLSIFNTDICRSVDIAYTGQSEFSGIHTYRYETTSEFLAATNKTGDNACFCPNKISAIEGMTTEDDCVFQGAMDLKNCVGAEVVLTLPHFLGADERYKDSVRGLRPDEKKHKIFVELEPNTGIPVRGGKRVQFNMFMQNFDKAPGLKIAVNWTDNLAPSLMPILWIDEGVELNQEMIDMLYDKLLNNLVLLEAVKWTLIAVGLALTIAFTGAFCYLHRRSKNTAIV